MHNNNDVLGGNLRVITCTPGFYGYITKRICFTGENIRNSVALEIADAGIVTGTWTDITRESEEVTMLIDDLSHVFYAKVIVKKTIYRVKWNNALTESNP